MRLVIVYGLKTGDHSWFSQFYPSRRLSEECANRSIPLRFLFPHEVPAFIEESGVITAETVCLIRGAVTEETHCALETAGFKCVNEWKSVALAQDKLETALFLGRHGWPTPKTLPLEALTDSPPLQFPFVVKPRFGSRGVGVRLIETSADFDSCLRTCEGVIAQEYIAASRGRDVRFFFASGTILAVAERHSAEGSFISNASAGGHMQRPSWLETVKGEYWAHTALDIARASGLWYGTVDFLYLDEKNLALTVCELNSSPGFESLETDEGVNIAGQLIDRLLADFG